MFFTDPSQYLTSNLPRYEKLKGRVKDEDFFIPNESEHYLLFKHNYTIPQLKLICKHGKTYIRRNKFTFK